MVMNAGRSSNAVGHGATSLLLIGFSGAELAADRELAKVEGRIETDRHGHIIMSPPPAPNHGSFQSEIAYLLRTLMPAGRVLTECPISTADGVKAADVAWASPERMEEL